MFQFYENRFIGKRYQTLKRAHIVEHQDTDNPPYYPLVFNVKTNSRNISENTRIKWPEAADSEDSEPFEIFDFLKSFMISLRYRRRNSATVIKVFINEEPVEAVGITSLISEAGVGKRIFSQ